jgi:hypothetical protein
LQADKGQRGRDGVSDNPSYNARLIL